MGTTETLVAVPGSYRIREQRFAPVRVLEPPLAAVSPTKRTEAIARQEQSLEREVENLEATTRARNLELHRHLEEIRCRGESWEKQLDYELEEREVDRKTSIIAFEACLAAAAAAQDLALMEIIQAFHGRELPRDEEDRDDLERSADVFTTETVPAVIDRQSGIVGRKLQKAHDTFDIENAKVLKREQKIRHRFSEHVARSAQGFEDERATRKSKFGLFAEEIHQTERRDDRDDETVETATAHTLRDLTTQLSEIAAVREREDNTLLDALLFSQKQLQASVLEAFGAEALT